VRELRHVMEHAFVVADGPTITRADLPPPLGGSHAPTAAHPAAAPEEAKGPSRAADVEDETSPAPAVPRGKRSEVERIQAALDESGGNIGEAARRLEMHRTTLWRKMRQFGIGG
jgi:transcriptional regulator of acetoin/glycerol metabolism